MKSALFALALTVSACAPIPTPRTLAELDDALVQPGATETKTRAPSAFATAEQLRRKAHEALESDRFAQAQFYAEEGLLALDRAVAMTRLSRADARSEAVSKDATVLELELTKLTGEQARLTQEVDALEKELKVTRDAAMISPSGKADPAREQARAAVVRSLLVEGRLLCGAAKLLGAPVTKDTSSDDPTSPARITSDLADAERDLGILEQEIGKGQPSKIDLATRTRAKCLDVLTRSRRATAVPAKDVSGALHEELTKFASATGLGSVSASRDERGIVLTLRNVFRGDELSDPARALLAEIDAVAKAHPEFAVAVVVHTEKPALDADKTKSDRVLAALVSVPVSRRLALFAGNFSPVVDPQGKDRSRNARVEIVFLPPRAL